MRLYNKKNNGFSILEVVVAIGIISLFVVGIAKVLQTVDTINALSEKKDMAYIYAQQSIEVINEIKNDLFVCSDSLGDSCTTGMDPDTCTRITGDGQVCDMFPAYSSCWTQYPDGLTGNNDFYLDSSGGWHLVAITPPAAEIIGTTGFTRSINIVNGQRNGDGDLVESGGTEDYNTKLITVTVWYDHKGTTRSVELKTILTGWENI